LALLNQAVLHCPLLAAVQVRSLRMPSDLIRDVLEGVLLVMGQVGGPPPPNIADGVWMQLAWCYRTLNWHTIFEAQEGKKG
jgi:hypothetical protein